MAEDTQRSPTVGDWVYVPSHHCHGRIIERTALWGHEIFRVWLPHSDAIVRVRGDEISTQHSALNAQHLTFVASAAKVADALTGGRPRLRPACSYSAPRRAGARPRPPAG